MEANASQLNFVLRLTSLYRKRNIEMVLLVLAMMANLSHYSLVSALKYFLCLSWLAVVIPRSIWGSVNADISVKTNKNHMYYPYPI